MSKNFQSRLIAAGVVAGLKGRPSGIDGAGFQSVIIADPSENGRVIVGGDVSGIHVSTNHGDSWGMRNAVMPRREYSNMAALVASDPAATSGAAGTIFAAGGNGTVGGVLRSTDHGETWTVQFDTTATASDGPNFIGGNTSDGVTPTTHPRRTGNLLALDESTATRYIYAGSYDRGVYRSANNGVTWTRIATVPSYIGSIELDPIDPTILYVGCHSATASGGLWKLTSVRTAATVTPVAMGTFEDVDDISCVAKTGKTVMFVAAYRGGLWKVTNLDTTPVYAAMAPATLLPSDEWISVKAWVPAGGGQIRCLAGNSNSHLVVGATYGTVAYTADGGGTWKWVTTSDNATIDLNIAGTTSPWWLMTDGRYNAPDRGTFVCASIDVDPFNEGTWWIAGRSGIWRTDDFGLTWKPAVNDQNSTVNRVVAVDQTDDLRVYYGNTDWVFLYSLDRGLTVTQNRPPAAPQWAAGTFTGPPNTVYDLKVVNGKVFMAAGDRDVNALGDVWVSADPTVGGWTALNLASVAASPLTAGPDAYGGGARPLGITVVRTTISGAARFIITAFVNQRGVWRIVLNTDFTVFQAWHRPTIEVTPGAPQPFTNTIGFDAGAKPGKKSFPTAAPKWSGFEGVMFAWDVSGTGTIFRSLDFGATWLVWRTAPVGFNGANDDLSFMAADPGSVGRLYVTDSTGWYTQSTAHNAAAAMTLRTFAGTPGPVEVYESDGTAFTARRQSATQTAGLMQTSRASAGAAFTDIADAYYKQAGGNPYSMAITANGDLHLASRGWGALVMDNAVVAGAGQFIAPGSIGSAGRMGEASLAGQVLDQIISPNSMGDQAVVGGPFASGAATIGVSSIPFTPQVGSPALSRTSAGLVVLTGTTAAKLDVPSPASPVIYDAQAWTSTASGPTTGIPIAVEMGQTTGVSGWEWLGGRILGTFPFGTVDRWDWTRTHSFGGAGLRINGNGAYQISYVRMHNVDDGFKPKENPSPNANAVWTIRHSYMTMIRDDAIENDNFSAGTVFDCLFDGVWTFLSEQNQTVTPVDLQAGESPYIYITKALVRLEITNDDETGSGKWFKWQPRTPGIGEPADVLHIPVIKDSVFATAQAPAQGSWSTIGFPSTTIWQGTNYILWLGAGTYPAAAPHPAGVTILEGQQAIDKWIEVRDDWLTRHGLSPIGGTTIPHSSTAATTAVPVSTIPDPTDQTVFPGSLGSVGLMGGPAAFTGPGIISPNTIGSAGTMGGPLAASGGAVISPNTIGDQSVVGAPGVEGEQVGGPPTGGPFGGDLRKRYVIRDRVPVEINHLFIAPDGASCLVPALGDWEANEEAPGGYMGASATLPDDLYSSRRDVFRFGTIWRSIMGSVNVPRWAGTLLDPAPSGNLWQLSGRGWGELPERKTERLMFRTNSYDAVAPADSDELKLTQAGIADKVDDEIEVEVDNAIRFTVQPGTKVDAGMVNRAAMYIPGVRLTKLSCSIRARTSQNYELRIAVAKGPNGDIRQIRTVNLNSAFSSLDEINLDTDDEDVLLFSLHCTANVASQGAKLVVTIRNLQVSGLATTEDFSSSQVVKVICDREGIPSTFVEASGDNMMPLDVQSESHADVLDRASIFSGWRWLLHDYGSGPVMEFGPWDTRTWTLADPELTPQLVPLERWNVVSVPFQYAHGKASDVAMVRAIPDLLDSDNIYSELAMDEPLPGKQNAEQMGRAVADYLVTKRWGGEATLSSVLDQNMQRVSAHMVQAGDTLYLSRYGVSLRIKELARHGADIDVTFDDRLAAVDRILERRKRRLASRGKV